MVHWKRHLRGSQIQGAAGGFAIATNEVDAIVPLVLTSTLVRSVIRRHTAIGPAPRGAEPIDPSAALNETVIEIRLDYLIFVSMLR